MTNNFSSYKRRNIYVRMRRCYAKAISMLQVTDIHLTVAAWFSVATVPQFSQFISSEDLTWALQRFDNYDLSPVLTPQGEENNLYLSKLLQSRFGSKDSSDVKYLYFLLMFYLIGLERRSAIKSATRNIFLIERASLLWFKNFCQSND